MPDTILGSFQALINCTFILTVSARAGHYYLSVIKATERVDITFHNSKGYVKWSHILKLDLSCFKDP